MTTSQTFCYGSGGGGGCGGQIRVLLLLGTYVEDCRLRPNWTIYQDENTADLFLAWGTDLSVLTFDNNFFKYEGWTWLQKYLALQRQKQTNIHSVSVIMLILQLMIKYGVSTI